MSKKEYKYRGREKEYRKEYAKAHPEKHRIATAKWRKKHRKEDNKASAEWAKKNRNRINKRRKERYKIPGIKAKWTSAKRQSDAKLKKRIIERYGGKCTCCGETEIMFLSIDHTNNDGAKRRKGGELCGQKLYRWLKPRKRMKRFQVLCRNCNWGKYVNDGVCPHKVTKDDIIRSTKK